MIKTNTRAHGSGPISFVSALMSTSVACRAQRDQVLLRIVAGVAAKLFVVDLQVQHRAARLTPPGITTQDLLPQPVVRRLIQPQARKFWANRAHDAFSLRPWEIVYFKLYQSQMPVIERAIETASLMLGSDRSRGYCLEMICADFLAGANLDNGDPVFCAQLSSLKSALVFRMPSLRLLLSNPQSLCRGNINIRLKVASNGADSTRHLINGKVARQAVWEGPQPS